jgi:hypothetical protein
MRHTVAMDRRALITLAALAVALPAAAAAPDTGEKKKTGGLSYLPLETLTSTIVRANGRRGVLTVELGLDVPDPKLRDRAASLQPRLRAAYVQSLQIYAAGLPAGTPPNVDYLSRELQRATDAQMGRPGARLLLGAIMAN